MDPRKTFLRFLSLLQETLSTALGTRQFSPHNTNSVHCLLCTTDFHTACLPRQRQPPVTLQLPLPGYLLKAGYGQEFLRVTKCTNVLL